MKKAKLTLSNGFFVGETDKRIFGSFIEHIGRAVYGGIYEPGHPSADGDGFRTDVMEMAKKLGVPIIRYPGGNFVSGYNWEDGVGLRENRPRRLDMAWHTVETNEFGTNEFVKWCGKMGADVLMCVNLGTRGMEDAKNLVEYCNFEKGTYYSDLRRSHGCEKPHNIKYWCLGNEMDGGWQIGCKNAADYGKLAKNAAHYMKLCDPTIETVICGSSHSRMPTVGDWEKEVLDIAWDHVDYISLHQYLSDNEHDLKNFLAKPMETERYIKFAAAACDLVQGKRRSKKRIGLSFDEWNVWRRTMNQKITEWDEAPPIVQDIYDFSDALVVGMMLNVLLRNCDRVKIACLAQLVNVIAPIMTETGGSAWEQTIYYPFMYASKYGRGRVLTGILDSPRYDSLEFTDVPYIDATAVYNEEKNEISIFAVNRDTEDEILFDISLLEFSGKREVLEHIAIEGHDPAQINTLNDVKVLPKQKEKPVIENNRLSVKLPPLSWNLVRVHLKQMRKLRQKAL
ncbi:MAG: alpha-N-arabinofuranosidase [Oscillospiraceae bacterium]|nr:alpha-N-arabinofuranosidase [Oscillospiraceae bacterium]